MKTFAIQPRDRLIVLIVGDVPDESHSLTVPVGAGCPHRPPIVLDRRTLYLIADLPDAPRCCDLPAVAIVVDDIGRVRRVKTDLARNGSTARR